MIERFFHRWEQRLADISKNDRVRRPFEWGLEWIGSNGGPPGGARQVSPSDAVRSWVDHVMKDTDAFFTPAATSDYTLTGNELTFPSALETPHAENNVVHARFFPTRKRPGHPRRAVVVLPQWNSDAGGHIGLSQLLARVGVSSLRLSLPYHDRRMPPELTRADYIVSSNIARTVQVCRQAVLDVRRAVWWLRDRGFDRIGVLGSSLGSCLALLT